MSAHSNFQDHAAVGTYFDNAKVPTRIPFEGPGSKNVLAFKHYNAEEVVMGKKMKDWLRFSVSNE